MNKKGVAVIGVLVAIAVTAIISGGYVAAKNFNFFDRSRKVDITRKKPDFKLPHLSSPLSGSNNPSSDQPSPSTSPKSEPHSPIVSKSPSPSPTPSGGPTVYKQPQGKYTITLPLGWVVNSTTATTTYSITKFTGPNGYVAITFGGGKDPIGGCSESSSVTLADRTISGCFLLQKDGSQLLTRTYTKDKAGIDFTIEAYINPPLSDNKPKILDVIKTIDIE